ncbi:hypothetical protein QL285_015117 [Trifolium repens]|nr:hypothetical protein QL285_015117 [Trifolium repens]
MNRRRKSEKGSVVVAQSGAWRRLLATGRWASTQNSGFTEEPMNRRWWSLGDQTQKFMLCSRVSHRITLKSRISCYKLLKLSHLSIHIMYRPRSTSFNIIKHHFK